MHHEYIRRSPNHDAISDCIVFSPCNVDAVTYGIVNVFKISQNIIISPNVTNLYVGKRLTYHDALILGVAERLS